MRADAKFNTGYKQNQTFPKKEMKYKPIHVQIGSQGTLLSAPSRTCKQFCYLCLHFPSQEEVWKLFHCNVENPCLQMLKVLEKYLHRAGSAGCVVTVDRKMKEGMKSSQGSNCMGNMKCQIVVDVGRVETNKRRWWQMSSQHRWQWCKNYMLASFWLEESFVTKHLLRTAGLQVNIGSM